MNLMQLFLTYRFARLFTLRLLAMAVSEDFGQTFNATAAAGAGRELVMVNAVFPTFINDGAIARITRKYQDI